MPTNGHTAKSIRFADTDIERIQAEANKEGVSFVEWVREAALKRLRNATAKPRVINLAAVAAEDEANQRMAQNLNTESPNRTSSVPEIIHQREPRRTSRTELTKVQFVEGQRDVMLAELKQVSKPAERTYARAEQGCAHAFRTPSGRCIACGNQRK